jgi:hypothetical protein
MRKRLLNVASERPIINESNRSRAMEKRIGDLVSAIGKLIARMDARNSG